ncbi:unnamed protein product [Rhizophagus irregularis]|nr:unnamed protein product [Rhizophagus irregularis]
MHNSTTFTDQLRLIMLGGTLQIQFLKQINRRHPSTGVSGHDKRMITENVNSVDHQKQQQTSSQSIKIQFLSTVWTTFRRLTNNIIISDDTDSVPNDFANLAFTSSSHNTGLASIITGENHYDTCYLPFGNHLTLSELCPPLHSYKSHSHYSSPSTSSYNKRRNSITTSSNTARIFLTPVSSSTSLKSFTSRAGSDCGLESGRDKRVIYKYCN